MSLIIDANCACAAFSDPAHADFVPIIKALVEGRARLVVGGKLREEYLRLSPVIRMFKTLNQAGRAISISDQAVNAEEVNISAKFKLSSNDPHIIALAKVSKSRLLCSKDQALHVDFTNPAIINKPRGYVYQNARHESLIKKCC